MDEGQAMRWFAELVDRGHVSKEAVGLSTDGRGQVVSLWLRFYLT